MSLVLDEYMTRLSPISAKKLIKILISFGFEEIRSKGSHKFFYNSQNHLSTTVPDHGSEDIGIGLLRKILRDAGINLEEFKKLK